MKHLITLPVFAPPDPPAPVVTPPVVTPPVVTPPPVATPPVVTPPVTAATAPVDDKGVTTPADWVPDWRERFAAGADGKTDAKVLERLKRYDSPVAFAKAGLEAQTKILSGKATDDTPMPDETKDAPGAKKWREERGIPADPTGYVLPDPIKAKLLPEDAPVLASYTAFAHKKGMAPAEVARGVEWYTDMVDAQAAERNAADKTQQTSVEEGLRKEWGSEFQPFKKVAQRYAEETIPGTNIFLARLPDGRMLGNVIDVVKGFATLGIAKYGDVAFAGGEAAKVTESRIAELKNIMSTDWDKWNASPALRKEYNDLLAAEAKRNPPKA